MKICVFGGTGMLGSMLVKVLSQHHQVIATTRKWNDIEMLPNVEWWHFEVGLRPLYSLVADSDYVINAIGQIPQRGGRNSSMKEINWYFPRDLTQITNDHGIKLIQVSTDCVFSGKIGSYDECRMPDATDEYGRSKICGEAKADNTTILRCSLVGPEKHGQSLLGWFLSQPDGSTVNGFVNHFWNGITTYQFARICEAIINSDISMPRIQHIVPADVITKLGLLELFREVYHRDIKINPFVNPVKLDKTLTTVRPELNLKLWQMVGYEQPPTIEQMVKEMANESNVSSGNTPGHYQNVASY